jgi:Flp pilus assembly protein TadG
MSVSGSKRFWRNDSGATAAFYALALPALVAVAGVGFDYARLAGMDSELQNAADQAALAGVTQLDGKTGACSRAASAASGLVSNSTLLANDGDGLAVSVDNEATCDTIGVIRFWQDDGRVTAATNDANAHFLEVVLGARTANYALTPVVGALSGDIVAAAMAGIGSSVCKVPPIMICHPDPGTTIDWSTMEGIGIQATGHNPGNSGNQGGSAGSSSAGTTWSPGNFGFLQVEDPDANNKNAALLRALAYANPPIDCTRVGDNKVSTGNPQGLYDAINTRFDVYDFNASGGGNVLASCQGSNCPPSTNVVKDFQNDNTSFTSNNSCKIHNNGWKLPDNEFNPVSGAGPYYQDTDDDGVAGANGEAVGAMGLPRDLCHYTTFNGTGWCGGAEDTGRFGDGAWAKYDYFKKNHGLTSPPSGVSSRYDAYRWELGLLGSGGSVPNTSTQRGSPVCFKGSAAAPNPTRRIMTVAVVSNCAELNGTSKPVVIDDWIDVFLVEPSIDNSKRHNAYKDAIYFEVIGPSALAGDGTYASQQVRRDVPYLVR